LIDQPVGIKMTRQHVLRIAAAVSLIIGWLLVTHWGVPPGAAQGFITSTSLVAPSPTISSCAMCEKAAASATAKAAVKPTSTVKTCHICDEDEAAPAGAATPTAFPAIVAPAGPEEPIVHAVMFWMNGCSHCHDVIENVLPPLRQKYGAQFDLQLIEVVTADDIDRLYQVGATFGFAKEQVGVPFLIIGDRALVGSDQIPAELPKLIEQHLAAGGVAAPQVPGFTLPAVSTAGCSVATPCAAAASLLSDGFALAIAIIIGMVGALGYVSAVSVRTLRLREVADLTTRVERLTPLLAVVGLGVAAYLAYVETQAVAAVCGPIGDCNAVQASAYARLFGVLPIGVLGVIGYVIILIAWAWSRYRSDRLAQLAPIVLFGSTVCGVLVSIYLTCLELFVIKAVCLWCLSSAVIMTALMVINLKPALHAVKEPHDSELP
jgi:uncharacterized membrane protein